MLSPKDLKIIQRLEKEAFNGIALLKEYPKTHLLKTKLALTRTYGIDKNLPYQPPLRKAFSEAFSIKKYTVCQEIIYQLYTRKIAVVPGVTQEIMKEIVYRFLSQASADQLDLGKLTPILDQEIANVPKQ
jgi:hypothetical protein